MKKCSTICTAWNTYTKLKCRLTFHCSEPTVRLKQRTQIIDIRFSTSKVRHLNWAWKLRTLTTYRHFERMPLKALVRTNSRRSASVCLEMSNSALSIMWQSIFYVIIRYLHTLASKFRRLSIYYLVSLCAGKHNLNVGENRIRYNILQAVKHVNI